MGQKDRLERRAARALALKDYKKTIRCLDELLAEVGENPHTLHMLAHCHERLGAGDQAIAYAERALSVDPDHTGSLQVLSRVYVRQEDYSRAYDCVTRALDTLALVPGPDTPPRGAKGFLWRVLRAGQTRDPVSSPGSVDAEWQEWARAFRRWYEEHADGSVPGPGAG